MDMKEKLSPKERARFEACKAQVAKWLEDRFETGLALTEIKNSRLYREDYDSFEDFCKSHHQLDKSYAYRLIEWCEVKKSPTGDKIQNERQARAIAEVPQEQRQAVIKLATKGGSPLTAKAIESAAEIVKKANESPKQVSPVGDTLPIVKATEYDELGCRIPSDALPFWHRRQEIQNILSEISRIKCLVEKAKKEGDCMFGKVSNGVIDQLTLAYSQISEAKPYAVCTSCQGVFSVQPKGCAFCGNKGLISKYQWDIQSKKEVKELRLRVIEKARATA